MATYVLLYRGGSLPDPGEVDRVMDAWSSWFGSIGADLVDRGSPFGAARSLGTDGSVSGGVGSGVTGYSIIGAANLDDATATAKRCPVLLSGATVEVHETVDVMAAQPA